MNIPKFAELHDKVVVITGGSGVLCSTLASALAEQGAKIALINLNTDKGNKLADEIRGNGGVAHAFPADVLNKSSLILAKEKINQTLGSCDLLINGAGGNHPKGTTTKTQFELNDIDQPELSTFFNLDTEGIQYVFNLNFIGTLLATQVFSQDMLGKQGCGIINISSMNAFKPLTKIPAYSGAKAAVSNFTQWLSVHFAPVNIRVNAIAPGFFLTDQNRQLLTNNDGELTNRGKSIIDHTPMNRFGDPEDLIGVTLWLCSDLSKFVTGTVIPIDGGFSAFSGI